ncbi:PP2C family protein-serine/threonine phosphatase [Nocardioides lijunqiniae]|uniref:PP2C family protein-serine/threonine phosphatase n=1 Tax=Nocardioides lijunqiniae TaxID=2760832 RepID=UPI00187768B2|nr:protein phosphatase 2C domain-containing protein [Nocardioides lijunqiniae]
MSLRLHYSAISDVGRVRKDNQDSGYAGAWLLAVCDGVGGAARGDIASATAIQTLRELDVPPADDTGADLLDRVADTLHEAHLRIGQLVDADPALNGTSTTATVALFDGDRVGMGHVGDSRAYLFRDKELSQLTKDHTFVQSLIDEGRITEAESRVHPHRNLILKALDGMQEADPDLFMIELVPGDRLFLCSDGACGVLDDGRLADILSMGTPDFAAVELVRASLEAGSSDNVTCLVADVVTEEAAADDPSYDALEPLLVGAAAELRRRAPRAKGSLFRGHRSGDTGELDPIEDEIVGGPGATSAPVDPEAARYAPIPPSRYQWVTRLLVLAVIAGVVWAGAAAAYSWTQRQYFVGESDGNVVIFRGINTDLPGMDLSDLYQTSDVELDRLSDYDAGRVRQGIEVSDLDAARETVQNLSAEMSPADEPTETPGDEPGDEPSELPTEIPTSGAATTDSAEGAG